MGIHGATLKNFSVAQIVRILVDDLGLHHLELTPDQIRLRAATQGSTQGSTASVSEVRDLRNLLQAALSA